MKEALESRVLELAGQSSVWKMIDVMSQAKGASVPSLIMDVLQHYTDSLEVCPVCVADAELSRGCPGCCGDRYLEQLTLNIRKE